MGFEKNGASEMILAALWQYESFVNTILILVLFGVIVYVYRDKF